MHSPLFVCYYVADRPSSRCAFRFRFHLENIRKARSIMPVFTKFRWQANESNTKDEYSAREKACIDYICWEALNVVAQKLRNTPCKFGEQYRFGARPVVREFVFEDDVHWMARVNLPETNLAAEDN